MIKGVRNGSVTVLRPARLVARALGAGRRGCLRHGQQQRMELCQGMALVPTPLRTLLCVLRANAHLEQHALLLARDPAQRLRTLLLHLLRRARGSP